MLSGELRSALLCAYPLHAVEQIEQVYNGNNRVYRLRCRASSPYDDIAIKVSALSAERGPAAKRLEQTILDCLHDEHAIAFVPRLLPPTTGSSPAQERPSGLVWNDDTLLSCYRWVVTQPYRGTEQQLVQVGRRYAELQRALSGIDPAALPSDIPLPPHRLVRAGGEGLHLAAVFSLDTFDAFIAARAGKCPACARLRGNRSFLENEIADLREVFDRHSQDLKSRDRRLIHQELSPGNFGFSSDHAVNMIFDFDSIAHGLPLQDTAWLCATFCVDYRKSLDEVLQASLLLLSVIESQMTLATSWRELLVPFMRLGYLGAIHRKLELAQDGVDGRLGFVREDILCLRWLRRHGDALTAYFDRSATLSTC